MSFIALTIEKESLVQEKSEYEYELTVATMNYRNATEEVATYAAQGKTADNDSDVAAVAAEQEIYESQKDELDSKLEVLNSEIESYNKVVQTNVKNDCKFTLTA